MKEIPELADKIRGAGGVKVCYGSDERVLSPMQQAWIADALVAYEKARTTPPEALRIQEPLLVRLRSIRDEAKRLCARAYDGCPPDRMDLNDHAFRLEELVKECAPSPPRRTSGKTTQPIEDGGAPFSTPGTIEP